MSIFSLENDDTTDVAFLMQRTATSFATNNLDGVASWLLERGFRQVTLCNPRVEYARLLNWDEALVALYHSGAYGVHGHNRPTRVVLLRRLRRWANDRDA